MTSLAVYYASAPADEVPISSLEILHPDIATILTCSGYEDQTLTLESGETLVFPASGLDVALPEKSTEGQQNLTFAIENVTGTALREIQRVLRGNSKEPIKVNYRLYLTSDLQHPKLVLKMLMVTADFQYVTTQVQASYMDIINRAWPRKRYTAEFAPGIKYISA